PLIESHLFHRRAEEHGAVVPRDEITVIAPRDASKRIALPGEMQKLAADGADGHAWSSRADVDFSRPAACGHDNRASRHRSASGIDDEVAVPLRDAPGARAFDELRAVTARGRDERARELAGAYISVRLDQQRAQRGPSELRLFGARFRGVEHRELHASRFETRRDIAEMVETLA